MLSAGDRDKFFRVGPCQTRNKPERVIEIWTGGRINDGIDQVGAVAVDDYDAVAMPNNYH